MPFGKDKIELDFVRRDGHLVIHAKTATGTQLCLAALGATDQRCEGSRTELEIPLHPVELSIPAVLPGAGDTTKQLKALNEEFGPKQARFEFEAQGGSTYTLALRLNRTGITVEGGKIVEGKLALAFPGGQGYVRKTVTFRWQ